MKQLVKTTGSFSLILPSTGITIQRRRPTVVPAGDHFVHSRAAVGQLKVLVSDLPDHATDTEWEACWTVAAGDYNLALASFLAIVNGETPDTPADADDKKPEPAPKPDTPADADDKKPEPAPKPGKPKN